MKEEKTLAQLLGETPSFTQRVDILTRYFEKGFISREDYELELERELNDEDNKR